MKGDAIQDSEDLRDFSAFAWVFDKAQSAQIQSWQNAAVLSQSARAKAARQQAITDTERSSKQTKRPPVTVITAPPIKTTVQPVSNATSSESAIVATSCANNEIDATSEVLECEATGLLSFFGSKAM